MLALCQEVYEPQEYLRKFAHVYVDETQTPVSMLPLSEDEQVSPFFLSSLYFSS